MAFINVELGGQKTSGGYLKIDGGKQIKLKEGLIIPVSAGTHYLSFSSKSGGERAMSNANAAVGNVRLANSMEKGAVDGEITVDLDENDMVFLSIVSDRKGNVLALPRYSVRELDEDELAQANEIISEQNVRAAAKSRKKKKIWGVVLAVLGIDTFFTGVGDGIEGIIGPIILIAVGVLLFLAGFLKKKDK